ncbi:hypothetical protein HZH68_013511 [Vespula germanica]|uniref:Uncharacterized protein n=1 Tax=Vespula germanica TaxID=30212 RepID=A0A834JDI0_VESGE|nr:hypothetical protein HZH68_013511 [Vespula germanica]
MVNYDFSTVWYDMVWYGIVCIWLLRMQEGNHQYLTRGTAELLDNELLPSASSDSIHIVSWLVSSSSSAGGGARR